MYNSAKLWTLVSTSSLAFAIAPVALAEDKQQIDVPAQPLPAALVEFADETGLTVMAAEETLTGKTSQEVQGLMTPEDGLRAMLQHTGLEVQTQHDAGAVVSQNAREDSFDLGTIVLRGELQVRTLRDSPTSAVVETGDELEKRGDVDVFSVIPRTPNVTAIGDNLDFSIRGIRGGGGVGAGRTITIQVDGVALPVGRSITNGPFSTWDLEQVEILRGPQSTQQGRNALAGAIILRSKDPTFDPEYRGRFEFGSRSFSRVAFSINQPLLDDRLAVRFSGESFETDDLVVNTALGGPAFPRSLETYRAKLLWAPTDRLEGIVSYSYTRGTGGERSFYGLSPDSPPVASFLDPQTRENENNQWGLRLSYDISDSVTLETETDYLDDTSLAARTSEGDPPNSTIGIGDGDREVFEQDIRLRFDTDPVQGVVGVFYTRIEEQFLNIQNFRPANTGLNLLDANFTTENYALYGELDLRADRVLPGLFFTLGARYDVEEFESVSTILGAITERTNPDYSAFLPKVGATYTWSDSQRLSFTIQRAYRAGGARISIDGVLNEFDAEFATNYELAYRGGFYDDLLQLSANAFFFKWNDQQVAVDSGRVFAGRPIFETANAGESELYGFEFTLDAQPTSALNLFGTLGYSQTEFIDFPSGNQNFAGQSFSNAPEWSLAFGYAYSFQNGLTLAMDGNYTADAFTSVPNNLVQKSQSHWLFNAQLTYEQGGLLWGAYVRNIFDNRYTATRFVDALNTNIAPNAPGGQLLRQTVNEPRTIGVYVERVF